MRTLTLWVLAACTTQEVPAWTPTPARARHCLDRAPVEDSAVADSGDSGRWRDVDCDGHAEPADCDDRNPYINPGRPEILNGGIDDDCRDGPEVAYNCGYTGGTLAFLPLLAVRRRREPS